MKTEVNSPHNQPRVRVYVINTCDFRYDGGGLFAGRPRELWKEYAVDPNSKKSMNRKDQIRLRSASVLVLMPDQEQGYTATLIGTGIGQRDIIFTREVLGISGSNRLQSELKRQGIKPVQIDRVILPSLHFTLGSNIVEKDNKGFYAPVFPEAEHVIHRAEYEAAMGRDKKTLGIYSEIYQGIRHDLEILERENANILLIDESQEVGTGIRVDHHGGVTEGYCSVTITMGSEKLLVSPLFFPTRFHIDPDVQFDFTMNRAETYYQKSLLLEKAFRERLLLLCAFDPSQAVGYINKDRAGSYSFEQIGGLTS